METLADSLRVVRASLPPDLVGNEATGELLALARALAPIHCAGFEVRLGDDDTVDLVQRVAAVRGEPVRLAQHIERQGLDRGDAAWRRVAAFCRAWSTPQSLLHRTVLAAFLGFDAGTMAAGAAGASPSLYLSLEPGAGVQHAHLLDVIAAAATLLRGAPLSQTTMEAVARCREALPEGAVVADVGFMLARPAEALRLVVAHLPRAGAADYLQHLSWAGPAPLIGTAEPLLPGALQHVILSLDVGAGVLPRVGLECYPGAAETDLPTWQAALDALARRGLCTAAKRAALLRWPGHVEPVDGAAPWPASLVHESLLNRTDQFLVLARRLTFLKLVCDERGIRQAKAYFGYGPRSFAPAPPTGVPSHHRGTPSRRPDTPARNGAPPAAAFIDEALRRGAGFLVDRRAADGLWLEFPRVLRGTDEWASAYVATVLAALPGARCRPAAAATWRALCRRRGNTDGWGYNAGLPVDADSTLWAVRLAAELGRAQEPRARAAREVLRRHVVDGGVATYHQAAAAALRDLLGDADLGGLLVAHTCVTAAAAAPEALGAEVTAALLSRQELDGRWRGYWWSDDEYTTWLAVDALARGRGDGGGSGDAVQRAARWALQRFDRDCVVWSRDLAGPSSFATALALAIVGAATATGDRGTTDSIVQGALRTLLEMQESNGGWPPAALMRMPPPDAVDGDARPRATALSADDHGLFTTATVLRALSSVRRAAAIRP